MKRLMLLFVILSMVLSLFSGCVAEDRPYVPTGDALIYDDEDLNATISPEDVEPQELSLAYYADRSMNPFACTDYTNRTLFSLIYQGLFSVNRNYEAIPILCKRFEIAEDYRSYTFYIDDTAQFSDGSRVTIDDVLASYEAAMESDYYGGRFTQVNDISLSGDGGIKFSLNTEMESLTLLLDVPIVKAREVSEPTPLGSGPYVLERGVSGASLRRNQSWWCNSASDLVVTAAMIPLINAGSETQIRDQFEFYDVGLVCADPCTDSYADFRCDYELWECENGIFIYLGVNIAYSDVFEENESLRANLTYAIDREALAEDNYRGFARAVTLPASPGSPYYSTGLAAKYAYDPVKFVQAVTNSPTPKEPVELLVNRDDSLRLRTARDIAAMLTECGLETITVEKNSRDYLEYIAAGNYDLYLGQTRLSTNMDLSEFFRPWGDMSFGGLSDATLYAYCKDALENSGNYYILHQAVANDGRVCPILFCSYAVYAERGLLTELQPSRDNVFFYTLGRTENDALIPIDYTVTVDDDEDEGAG